MVAFVLWLPASEVFICLVNSSVHIFLLMFPSFFVCKDFIQCGGLCIMVFSFRGLHLSCICSSVQIFLLMFPCLVVIWTFVKCVALFFSSPASPVSIYPIFKSIQAFLLLFSYFVTACAPTQCWSVYFLFSCIAEVCAPTDCVGLCCIAFYFPRLYLSYLHSLVFRYSW